MIISTDFLIETHARILATSGGLNGVRNRNILEAAVHSIYQTFDGKDLYPSIIEKACRLSYLLNTNHAFIDGNKRVAMHILALSLRMHNIDYRPTNQEVVFVGLAVANGQMNYDDLLKWVTSIINPTK